MSLNTCLYTVLCLTALHYAVKSAQCSEFDVDQNSWKYLRKTALRCLPAFRNATVECRRSVNNKVEEQSPEKIFQSLLDGLIVLTKVPSSPLKS